MDVLLGSCQLTNYKMSIIPLKIMKFDRNSKLLLSLLLRASFTKFVLHVTTLVRHSHWLVGEMIVMSNYSTFGIEYFVANAANVGWLWVGAHRKIRL